MNASSAAYLLEGFAGIAALRGDHEQALRLLGVATRLREELGMALSLLELAHQAAILAQLKGVLSKKDYKAAWGKVGGEIFERR